MTTSEEIAQPRPDLATVGESMVMFTPDPPVPLADARQVAIHVGGAESNVATYLAELGFRTQWASMVGDDPFATIILRRLATSGVDVSGVETVAGARTGVYVKDPSDGVTTVYYFRHLSAATLLTPDFLARALTSRARVLHLSGVTAALSSTALDLLWEALDGRSRYGAVTSFDVNFRPGLWTAAEAAPVLAALANRSDVVFVGLDEANVLWGCANAEQVREVLAGASRVVVKDGANGAYTLGPEGVAFEPSLRVSVVEPVGAGDAFAAGYLAAALEGCAERQRLRMGHLLASAALTVSSDLAPAPSRADLLRCRDLTVEEWSQLHVEPAGGAHDGFVRTGMDHV